MNSEKAGLVSIHCLAFLDYVKAFDRVKRDTLFEILQNNIPNILLKV
jgi:hypothetical protein